MMQTQKDGEYFETFAPSFPNNAKRFGAKAHSQTGRNFNYSVKINYCSAPQSATPLSTTGRVAQVVTYWCDGF